METIKSVKNILMDVDNDLCGAEITMEKCKYQSAQLCDDFEAIKEDYEKIYNWENYRIMSCILLDYVIKTKELLERLRKNFELLWDKEREAATLQQNCSNQSKETDCKERIIKLLDASNDRQLGLIYAFSQSLLG